MTGSFHQQLREIKYLLNIHSCVYWLIQRNILFIYLGRGRLFYWVIDLCNHQGHYLQVREVELCFLVSSSCSVLTISSFLAWSHSPWYLRASLILDLRGSAWSARSFLRASSAFNLWLCSTRIHLFLNTLPFTFRYGLWCTRLSILDSRYLLSSQWRILFPPHPGYLLRYSRTGSAFSLTYTPMPALPASQGVFLALSLETEQSQAPGWWVHLWSASKSAYESSH